VSVLPDGGFDVQSIFGTYHGVVAKHVLAVDEGGVGALLREAAAQGLDVLVDRLLRVGVSPFVVSGDATTALHRAAAAGSVSVCRRLVAAGAGHEVGNMGAISAYDLSFARRRVGVRRLFSPSASDSDVTEEARTGSALLRAAHAGDAAAVRSAIEGGEEVDAVAANGVTALMLASRSDAVEAVRALLDGGARVAARSEGGCSALTMAAAEGAAEAVEVLLRAGAEVDAAERGGRTALMRASENGWEACVRALLQAGAAVDRAANGGATPLLIACQTGREACARALLQAGASADRATKLWRNTPRTIATKKGLTALVAMMPPRDSGEHERCCVS
jgi:hypothetical protein